MPPVETHAVNKKKALCHTYTRTHTHTHQALWLQCRFAVANESPYVGSAGNCVEAMDASDFLGKRWRMMAARGGWNSDKGGKGGSKGTINDNNAGLRRSSREHADEYVYGRREVSTPPTGCTSNDFKQRSRSPRMKEDFNRWASEETYGDVSLEYLPKDMTMKEVRRIVVEYGEVKSINIAEQNDTKSAIIKYAHEYDAWKAVNELDDRCMEDWDKRLRARVLKRPGSKKILVQDLPKDTHIFEVRKWGREHGKVFAVDLWEEKDTKSAIIEYVQEEDAVKAVNEFNGRHMADKEFNGRYMRASVMD